MAVTATTVAAATTMLAAVAAVFLTLVLCFYIFLCAKRYRGDASHPPYSGNGSGGGVRAWLRAVFGGGGGEGGAHGGGAGTEWCYDGGLDDKSMAKLPCREVGKGEEAADCAVCLAELAPGDTARVLPRCGHAFHVACVDTWLRSHSTCPLCRCPAVDDPPLPPPAVPTPVADPESPNFPTNVLFFGSQDDVSTGRSQSHHQHTVAPSPPQEHAAVGDAARPCAGLRRLIGCGGAAPPTQPPQRCDCDRRHHHHHLQEEDDAGGDIEMGLAAGGGESSASRPGKPAQPGS